MSTLVLLLNLHAILATVFEGLAAAVAAQVGINITFQANVAYRYACAGQVLGGILLLGVNGALYYFGGGWLKVLSDGNQDQFRQAMDLAPLLMVFLVLQSSISLMIAVLRGSGKLGTGSVATCGLIATGVFLSSLLGHREHYREV